MFHSGLINETWMDVRQVWGEEPEEWDICFSVFHMCKVFRYDHMFIMYTICIYSSYIYIYVYRYTCVIVLILVQILMCKVWCIYVYNNIHSLFTYSNVDLCILLYGIWMYAYDSSCFSTLVYPKQMLTYPSQFPPKFDNSKRCFQKPPKTTTFICLRWSEKESIFPKGWWKCWFTMVESKKYITNPRLASS